MGEPAGESCQPEQQLTSSGGPGDRRKAKMNLGFVSVEEGSNFRILGNEGGRIYWEGTADDVRGKVLKSCRVWGAKIAGNGE